MSKQVKITWTPSSGNTVAPTSQVVQRSATETGTYSTIHTFADNTSHEYIDTSVADGETWWYRIGAVFASGNTKYLTPDDITISEAIDITNASLSATKDISSFVGSSAMSIFFNPAGTQAIMLDDGGDDVLGLDVSSAWSALAVSDSGDSLDMTARTTATTSVTYNNDGSRLFVMAYNGSMLYEFSLSDAYKLSGTVTFIQEKDLSALSLSLGHHRWNSDGTKIFVAIETSVILYELSVGTAYNISTINLTPLNTFNIKSGTTISAMKRIDFSDDYKQLFISVIDTTEFVQQYTLPTAASLSGISYDNKRFSVSGQCRGLFITSAQKKMFILDRAADNLLEYDLS